MVLPAKQAVFAPPEELLTVNLDDGRSAVSVMFVFLRVLRKRTYHAYSYSIAGTLHQPVIDTFRRRVESSTLVAWLFFGDKTILPALQWTFNISTPPLSYAAACSVLPL
jgi:hypothetical protein